MTAVRVRPPWWKRALHILGIVLLCLVGLAIVLIAGLALFVKWLDRNGHGGALNLPHGRTQQGQYYYGHEDAPITVTEYADFQCPGCQAFSQLRGTFLRRELRAGKVKFVFADYPLPFHFNAVPAAVAARCAGRQGQFWAYHDKLYAGQDEWKGLAEPTPVFARYAAELGVEKAAFGACLRSKAERAAVEASVRRGHALQAPGTPSFAVNGKVVPWGETDGVLSIVSDVGERVREVLRQR